LVSDQAAPLAGPVPAPRHRPAGEVRPAGRADGAARRLAAAHERQRPAGPQPALEARRHAGARARGAGPGAGRTRRRLAPALAAQSALTPPARRRRVETGFTRPVPAFSPW